jgi:serine/threonine protein kinase
VTQERVVDISKYIRDSLEGYHESGHLTDTVSVLVKDSDEGEVIVVKQLPFLGSAEVAFEREVNALFQMHHPCVLSLRFIILPQAPRSVTIRGKHVEQPGIGPRIATDFVGSHTLKSVLASPPDWWTATRQSQSVMSIVLGMSYIHSRGLIHRDLKPANILVDNDHRIVIADFGSSREYERDITATENVGTPLYRAPEVSGGSYDQKVDVYSFGLILYEIVVGEGILSTPEGCARAYETIRRKNRPIIPGGVLKGVRNLIELCWSGKAAERPSFSDIERELTKMNYAIVDGVDSIHVRKFIEAVEETARIPKR